MNKFYDIVETIIMTMVAIILTTMVVGGIVIALTNCTPPPEVKLDNLQSCMAPTGRYKLVTEGTIPPVKELRDMMCPLDMFLRFHQEDILNIQANDPMVLCGKHTVDLPNGGVSTILTTKDGIIGTVIMPIKVTEKLTCNTYYVVRFEKLPDNQVVPPQPPTKERSNREPLDRLPRGF